MQGGPPHAKIGSVVARSISLVLAASVLAMGCSAAERGRAHAAAVQASWDDAWSKLRAQGYYRVDDQNQSAWLAHADRCLDDTGDELLTVFVEKAGDIKPGVPIHGIELHVPRETACGFFRGDVDRLQGQEGDGNVRPIVRISDTAVPARSSKGQLVLIEPARRSRGRVIPDWKRDRCFGRSAQPLDVLMMRRRVLIATDLPVVVEMIYDVDEDVPKCVDDPESP